MLASEIAYSSNTPDELTVFVVDKSDTWHVTNPACLYIGMTLKGQGGQDCGELYLLLQVSAAL